MFSRISFPKQKPQGSSEGEIKQISPKGTTPVLPFMAPSPIIFQACTHKLHCSSTLALQNILINQGSVDNFVFLVFKIMESNFFWK